MRQRTAQLYIQTELNSYLCLVYLLTETINRRRMLLFVGCLTSQQHASVSQGRICTDNFTCCHTEMEAADQTFHLTQSQYTDTGPTSPSADPITPGAWQGSHSTKERMLLLLLIVVCSTSPQHATAVQERASSDICTFSTLNRLVGLVVKASASRAGGPGFESR